MPESRLLVALAVVAALALFVIAGIYFAEPAKSLPSFFPGMRPAPRPTTSSTASRRPSSGWR